MSPSSLGPGDLAGWSAAERQIMVNSTPYRMGRSSWGGCVLERLAQGQRWQSVSALLQPGQPASRLRAWEDLEG